MYENLHTKKTVIPSCFRNHRTFLLAQSQEEEALFLMLLYSALLFPYLIEINDDLHVLSNFLPFMELSSSCQLQVFLGPTVSSVPMHTCLNLSATRVGAEDRGRNKISIIPAFWELTALLRRRTRELNTMIREAWDVQTRSGRGTHFRLESYTGLLGGKVPKQRPKG